MEPACGSVCELERLDWRWFEGVSSWKRTVLRERGLLGWAGVGRDGLLPWAVG